MTTKARALSEVARKLRVLAKDAPDRSRDKLMEIAARFEGLASKEAFGGRPSDNDNDG